MKSGRFVVIISRKGAPNLGRNKWQGRVCVMQLVLSRGHVEFCKDEVVVVQQVKYLGRKALQ